VTIDPTRDTPGVLKSYLADFNSHIKGLTGSEEEVARVARQYRVYYRPARTTGSTNQQNSLGIREGEYLMDHSTFVFLVDPKGRYVTHFGRESLPERSASTILDAMDSYIDV
jgi:protein SCO1/2